MEHNLYVFSNVNWPFVLKTKNLYWVFSYFLVPRIFRFGMEKGDIDDAIEDVTNYIQAAESMFSLVQ
jgi:hypothetical protein